MSKLPKFKCNDCGIKLDILEIHIFPAAPTTYDFDGSPITNEIRLCEKCNDGRLGKNLNISEEEIQKAMDKIEPYIDKATEKQKAYLKKLGFKNNMEKLTNTKASRLIRELLKKRN